MKKLQKKIGKRRCKQRQISRAQTVMELLAPVKMSNTIKRIRGNFLTLVTFYFDIWQRGCPAGIRRLE